MAQSSESEPTRLPPAGAARPAVEQGSASGSRRTAKGEKKSSEKKSSGDSGRGGKSAPQIAKRSKQESSNRTTQRFRQPLPTPTPVGHEAKQLVEEAAAKGDARRERLTRDQFDQLLSANRRSPAELPDRIDDHPADLQQDGLTIIDSVGRHRRPLSSMLISTIVHLGLLVALALLFKPQMPGDSAITLEAAIEADALEPDREEDLSKETVQIDLPEQTQSPVEDQASDISLENELNLEHAEVATPSPVIAEAKPVETLPTLTVDAALTLPTGGGLSGRDKASRSKMAASRGGSQASEASVERGLRWIVNHQHRDGSFRLRHDHGNCRGQCPNEATMESTTAATGLAVMAFLGAGYTHKSGPYQDEVQRALDFLLGSIRDTPRGGNLARGDRGMYSHAIATIALSEALAMTRDTMLDAPVASARRYIETAQHQRGGGWRYNPGNRGDMTVTGWQLMALKSCHMAGYPTRKEVWADAEGFINSLRTSSGFYGYLKPSEHPTATAVASLMRMYLGAPLEDADVEVAANHVAGFGPSESDIYFNYYGTQVLFHRGGKPWEQWNERLRRYLVATQDTSGTHRDGSWYFVDQHGVVGGRFYTTAMAIMTLEVYYRYLPLYDQDAMSDPLLNDDN